MVSGDDQALAVSRLVWGDSIRLGAIDPNVEPYRSELERQNIGVLNLSTVKGDDPLNHGKFASGDVVALLGKRLADGQPITDGQVGFGDKLVSTAAGPPPRSRPARPSRSRLRWPSSTRRRARPTASTCPTSAPACGTRSVRRSTWLAHPCGP